METRADDVVPGLPKRVFAVEIGSAGLTMVNLVLAPVPVP